MENKNLMIVILTTHPVAAKEKLLNCKQLELVKFIKSRQQGVTASEVAGNYNISLQNASLKVRVLYRKKYVVRARIIDGTGGFYYRYQIDPDFKYIDIAS